MPKTFLFEHVNDFYFVLLHYCSNAIIKTGSGADCYRFKAEKDLENYL